MVEVSKKKIGKADHEVFTVLNEGFCRNGWVELECRLSDFKSEGVVFFMDVSDCQVAKNGRYSPLTMNKSDLKLYIDYLKKMYVQMP